MKEILKALNENKELSEKVKKIWKEKASAGDIQALLKEEGYDVDISVVEEALQRSQNEFAKKVAMEKLDDEALTAVSGGGSCGTTESCDRVIKECETGYVNPTCDNNDRCTYEAYCGTYFSCKENEY